MGNWEWPLVIFTVLGQTAVGMIFCLWLTERKRSKSGAAPSPEYQSFIKSSVLVSGLLLAVAMLASLFHLGQPLAAYRALTHLSTSWLSREILFFALTLGVWVYLFVLSRKPGTRLTGILALTSLLGLLGIISSALIYTLPRVPAWNNLGPVLFFLLTGLLLGALVIAALGRKALGQAEMKQTVCLALGSVLASLFLYLFYFSGLKVTPEGGATAQILFASPLFWLRAVVGWLLPLILLLVTVSKKEKPQPGLILLVLTCGVVGELLGRGLFYLSAVGIQILGLL